MLRRPRKFLALPAQERSLILRAFLTLVAASFALRLLPFSSVRRWSASIAPASAQAPSVASIARAVDVASRYVPGTACLARALVCQRMLGAAGWECTLRIGVAKDGKAGITAHAWLERDGTVIFGDVPELPKYSSLSGREI